MKTGDQAIPFTLPDIYGNQVSLEAFAGKKIYLSFLRTASCPFCNLRVHELIKKQEKWSQQDVVTIVVFASPASEILEYAGKQQPSFSVLADPDETLYKRYGIVHSPLAMLKSMLRIHTILQTMQKGFFNLKTMTDKPVLTGDFLINEDGTINVAYYGEDFGDHLSFEEIERAFGVEPKMKMVEA